jgi:hypothetical protein
MEFFLRHTGQIHLLLYVLLQSKEVFGFPDLYSTQEEADTRMILQALHADKRLKELGKQGRIVRLFLSAVQVRKTKDFLV